MSKTNGGKTAALAAGAPRLDTGRLSSPELALEAVQRSHPGRLRPRNEDATFAFTAESGGEAPLLSFGLYLLADGLGGHRDGHEASRIVTRSVAADLLERLYLPLLHAPAGGGPGATAPVQEVLAEAAEAANRAIYDPDPEQDSATTLTACLLLGRRLYLAHVGDSRAYLWADGQLTQLTSDHTYVHWLVQAGQLSEAQAAQHPQRNTLYRAVGQAEQLELDTYTRMLPPAGKLLLCSDGLWGLAPAEALAQALAADSSLAAQADHLVELALEAGGTDNISLVLAAFKAHSGR
ncbi:MAG: PP2C family protein-serine/threonine phosphatase [Candidatus Promineifilaceae bacterium]